MRSSPPRTRSATLQAGVQRFVGTTVVLNNADRRSAGTHVRPPAATVVPAGCGTWLAEGEPVLSGQKRPGCRCPLGVNGDASWRCHRVTLSSRHVEDLRLARGFCVTRESIRTWCTTFGDQCAQGRRHLNPRRGSGWHLDEMRVDAGGVTHWVWRVALEHGGGLDVVLQRRRDMGAPTAFCRRLLGEHGVPVTEHTDKLCSDGAALRTLPVLYGVEPVPVTSTARCNNLIEQSHRLTRRQERQQCGLRSRRRAQGCLDMHARITNLHHPAHFTVPARHRRHHQKQAFCLWREVVQQAA